jgi:hypothetical protein
MNVQGLFVYLASPYTGSIQEQQQRFVEAQAATAWLLNKGVFVYSPIGACHPLANLHKLPTDWKFWAEYDKMFISRVDEFWVLKIPGWDRSVGVTAEIKFAREIGKPIKEVSRDEELRYQIVEFKDSLQSKSAS